jgi:hypothetical protein
MSKKLYSIDFISPQDGSEYGFHIYLTSEQVKLIEGAKIKGVYGIVNTIPEWIAGLGLVRFWCFFQDIFNFKNPFRRD